MDTIISASEGQEMYIFPEEMRKTYESSPLSFVYYQNLDDRPVPILASEGFCRKTGMKREHVLTWLATGMFERMHPDDVGVVSKVSREFMHRSGPYDIVFRCRIASVDPDPAAPGDAKREPVYVPIHGYGQWQTMPDGTELMVISYANLSETQEVLREKMEQYGLFQRDRFYSDPLTELPNINYLHEFGEEKIGTIRADGCTPMVIYTDVCSMQAYNNKYSFREGDKLLCLVARTLREKFPKALLIRGADDHFYMITGVDIRSDLERRLNEANDIIRKNAHGNTLGICSGVCPVSGDMEMTEALDHAKHALKSIENNRNRAVAFFSQEADDTYWKNLYIVENFDSALENGWIKVYYHGLYRVESKKVAAFEALARWADPVRGIISPGEFIPVLQKYHLLYKLDLYMFEQVCREVQIRYENKLPLVPVSVNFSRQDFDHADIVGQMNRIYERYGMERYLKKSDFIVEITEQDVAVGTDCFREQLRDIRDNGYRLWLDDFGSGYSAINMFSRFEFDLIKFDMDLMRHLDDHGGANRLILKELVYVVKKLGIHTLIEGVETAEQLAFSRQIGCELTQGFYFHKPEPLDMVLFRIRGGGTVKDCETPEEREVFQRKWFE